MFNKKTTDAYRKIKAPASLKNKILDMEVRYNRRKNFPVYIRRSVLTTAAGFLVFVCCLSLVLISVLQAPVTEVKSGDSITLTKSARVLKAETVEYEEENQIQLFDTGISAATVKKSLHNAGNCIFFSLKTESSAALTVDSGNILIYDSKRDAYINVGQNTVISGGCELYWQLPEESADSTHTMSISGEKENTSVIIQFENETGTYTASYVKN
jgi:hypothetical protein